MSPLNTSGAVTGVGGHGGGVGGAPGAVWVGQLSKSVAKALRVGIGREKNRGISTILLRRSGAMGVFATDLDKRRRRGPREGRPGPDGARGGRPARPGGPAGVSAAVAIGPAATARPSPLGAPGRRDVHFALERAVPTVILEWWCQGVVAPLRVRRSDRCASWGEGR